MSESARVIVLGGEPAALSCIAQLLARGVLVTHLYPVPWGLLGASRDIGLAYPENGEPIERLVDALGPEIAAEFHQWGRTGVELLTEASLEWDGLRRGSRLAVTRSERESFLVGNDALDRQKFSDEVRLMSGAAASNYAPFENLHQASFETHAAAFAPVALCQYLLQQFTRCENYQAHELSADSDWVDCRLTTDRHGVNVDWGSRPGLNADLVLVAAAGETGRLVGKFQRILVNLLGHAFCSEPLRETSRSSVVGLTASWGFERYRFDPERRLLGCGIDPGSGVRHSEAVVIPSVKDAFWKRSEQLFSDLHRSGEETQHWGVLFTTTCDGLPLLGPLPGEPRIHVAAGFSTSAWSRGYAAGDVLGRALVGGDDSSALLQRCSPRRFL